MICGACGGRVRGFRGIRYGRPIADWKHTDVPPGTEPHRPVLGRPVDQESLDRIHRPVVELEEKAEKHQPVITWTGPASEDLLASSQGITGVTNLVVAEGWDRLLAEHRVREDGVQYVVMKLRRRDLGAVALWVSPTPGPVWQWRFDDGWALTPKGARQVQSTSLKEWLKTRDEECPDCGASSVVHGEECS